MAFDPSTTFDWTDVPKWWGKRFCIDTPYAANPITYLNPGIKIESLDPHVARIPWAGSQTQRFEGLRGKGWGFGVASPNCDIEFSWRNFAHGGAAFNGYIGLWLKFPIVTVHDQSHTLGRVDDGIFIGRRKTNVADDWVVVEQYYGAFTVKNTAAYTPSSKDWVRIERTGQKAFNLYYYSGGWQLLQAFSGQANWDDYKLAEVELSMHRDNNTAGTTYDVSGEYVEFKVNSGDVIPDTDVLGPSEDFADGVIETNRYVNHVDGNNYVNKYTEQAGYGQVDWTVFSVNPSIGQKLLWTHHFYPYDGTDDTNIDVTFAGIELEMDVVGGTLYSYIFFSNLSQDFVLDCHAAIRLTATQATGIVAGDFIRRVRNGGVTVGSDSKGGGLPVVVDIRVTRTGSVWEAFFEGSSLGTYDDVDGYLTDHPICMRTSNDSTSSPAGSTTYVRYPDVAVTKGDYRPIVPEPAPPEYNLSFENVGDAPGQAESWIQTRDDGGEETAQFEGSELPFDDFEAGWGGGNQISLEEFEDDDLEAATYNDSTAETEEFDWEWKSPVVSGSFEVTSDAAFTVGQLYRDKTYGGRAICVAKPGGDVIDVLYVDHVNPGSGGFAQEVALPDYPTLSTIAELAYNYHLLGTGDGYVKTFGGTIPNTPIHEGKLTITVTIGGTEYTIVDDGAGNLTGSVLDTSGNNTINYATGVYALAFTTAPASGQKIESRYEWGADVSSPSSNPIVLGGAFQITQRPPWNHTGIDEFTATDLILGITETYEIDWLSNQNWQETFAPADLTVAQFDSVTEDYEDFEEDWDSNENWQATFDPGDITAATFDVALDAYEDFETEWTTQLQV